MNLKDLMMKYGVTCGKRYTKSEKNLFLSEVLKDLEQNKIPYTVQKKSSSLMSIRNVIIGDKNAPIVFAVAYDTPSLSLNPKYHYYPFQNKKNKTAHIIDILIYTIITLIFFALAIWMMYLAKSNTSLGLRIIFIILMILALMVAYRYSKGISNPYNFNSNSASVALIMDLAIKTKGKNVCFVLLDQSINSFEGTKILQEEIPSSKRLIFLNSLAKGDYKIVAHAKNIESIELDAFQDHALTEFQVEQCLLGVYQNSVMVISGDRLNNDFIVRNSAKPNDNTIDMNSLENISDSFLKMIERETK